MVRTPSYSGKALAAVLSVVLCLWGRVDAGRGFVFDRIAAERWFGVPLAGDEPGCLGLVVFVKVQLLAFLQKEFPKGNKDENQ